MGTASVDLDIMDTIQMFLPANNGSLMGTASVDLDIMDTIQMFLPANNG
jgi:hypothetical protein